MARWKPLAAIAVIALLATGQGVFAQTATPRPKPAARNTTPYPAIVRTNFMTACGKDGTLSEALCTCIYRNMEREMTLEEFADLDAKAQADPNLPPPKSVEGIVVACFQDNSY